MSSREKLYDGYKRLFLFDQDYLSLPDFVKRYEIPDAQNFIMYAQRNDWMFERDEYRKQSLDRVKMTVADLESMSVLQKLREIEVLKTRAFEQALTKQFRDAGQAISAYTDLEKLQRLMLDKSTENVHIEDLNKYMLGVAMIVKSSVPEGPLLDNLIEQLSNFSFSDARKSNFEMPKA
jgi:C-terminal processing protease CtpA/Prc